MAIQSVKNIRKTIDLPSKYNDEQRREIGERIIERIKKRSASGIDLNGRSFKYVKDSQYKGNNLTDSHDMMDSIEILQTPPTQVTIGFADSSSIEANQAEGNSLGTYGSNKSDSSKAKPFLGINQAELSLILATYDQEIESGSTEEEQVSDVTDLFISSILETQGLKE